LINPPSNPMSNLMPNPMPNLMPNLMPNPISNPIPNLNQCKAYQVSHSPFDPCPPIGFRSYVIPPNVYMPVQPPGLPQFSPAEALRHGTLWPAYFSLYPCEPKGVIHK
jgi:spore coat protein JA